jgi:glutaconate CoA-transferase subunit A
VQKEAVLAARRALVTVEEVVDGSSRARRDRPPVVGDRRVAGRPGGARPSYAHGYSMRDNDFYIAWDAISRDRETFLRWMEEHVLDA